MSLKKKRKKKKSAWCACSLGNASLLDVKVQTHLKAAAVIYIEKKKKPKRSGNAQSVSKVPKILSKMQLPCFRLFLIDLLEPFKQILHSPSRHIKVDGGVPVPARCSAGINFTLLKFDKHFKKLRQVSCIAGFFFLFP